MKRALGLFRAATLFSLTLAALVSPPPVLADPSVSITIDWVGDPSDPNGGPYWLPPTESITLDTPGYITDRSRHKGNDLLIRARVVSNGSQVQSVNLVWRESSNPDAGDGSVVATVAFPGPPVNDVWSIHTIQALPTSPNPNKYYSFDVIAADELSQNTVSWMKLGAHSIPADPMYVRRWVQLACTENFVPYSPHYLRIGSFGQIGNFDLGAKDRYRHDAANDLGYYDSGALLSDLPGSSVEQRWCLQLVNYWFDDNVTVKDDDDDRTPITNMYYHIWYSSRSDVLTPSWASLRRSRGGPSQELSGAAVPASSGPTFFWRGDPNHDDVNLNPVYGLVTDTQVIGQNSANEFSDNSIYEMFLQMFKYPGYPACINSRRTPSFVLFNVPPVEELRTMDSDQDGLNDDLELNTHHTSPFLADTDADTQTDPTEVANQTNPNDPCNLKMVTPNGGEVWTVGQVKSIQFATVPPGCTEAKLYVKRGSQDWQLIASLAPNDNHFDWTVTGPVSTQCLIKESFDINDPGDQSNAVFTIKSPSVSLSVPMELRQDGPGSRRATIEFSLHEASSVTLSVFSVSGSKVATLVDGHLEPGVHSLTWDGTGADHRAVAAGMYFVRLVTPARDETRKILLR